eukprot:1158109-Pelagomonas_calceolata.AAC.5
MPCNLATQAMGQLGGRLLDGLLTGGQDASLEGWPKTCLIHSPRSEEVDHLRGKSFQRRDIGKGNQPTSAKQMERTESTRSRRQQLCALASQAISNE